MDSLWIFFMEMFKDFLMENLWPLLLAVSNFQGKTLPAPYAADP